MNIVLNYNEAIVECITYKYNDERLCLKYGRQYKANLMIGLQYAKTSGFISVNVSGKYELV